MTKGYHFNLLINTFPMFVQSLQRVSKVLKGCHSLKYYSQQLENPTSLVISKAKHLIIPNIKNLESISLPLSKTSIFIP